MLGLEIICHETRQDAIEAVVSAWYSRKEKIFAWNKGRPHSGLVEIVDNGVLGRGGRYAGVLGRRAAVMYFVEEGFFCILYL